MPKYLGAGPFLPSLPLLFLSLSFLPLLALKAGPLKYSWWVSGSGVRNRI